MLMIVSIAMQIKNQYPGWIIAIVIFSLFFISLFGIAIYRMVK
jgi:hypothetical protein